MSARGLTATLAVSTIGIWGCWIASSGVERNLGLIGLMPFSDERGAWLILPIGLFAGIIILAWMTKNRFVAWMIPMVSVIGFLLFWARYMMGMSHFG